MPVAHSARFQSEWERIARERLAAEREARRAARWELVRVSLQCLGSAALGLLGMALGLHTTDYLSGEIYWWGGLVAGYGGIAWTLAAAYLRGEARGDW